jgi:hypothetical protein
MLALPSSHEVFRPSSAPNASNRLVTLSGQVWIPLQTPSPLSLSQTLKGLILNTSHGLVSYRSRSWGFDPSRYSPPKNCLQARHLVLPSRRFPVHSASVVETTPRSWPVAPSGLLSFRSPFSLQEYCIPNRADTLLGFSAFMAFGNLGWSSFERFHRLHSPALALPRRTVHARPDAEASAYSHQVTSISRSRGRWPF